MCARDERLDLFHMHIGLFRKLMLENIEMDFSDFDKDSVKLITVLSVVC